jgi:hypothetical protein
MSFSIVLVFIYKFFYLQFWNRKSKFLCVIIF